MVDKFLDLKSLCFLSINYFWNSTLTFAIWNYNKYKNFLGKFIRYIVRDRARSQTETGGNFLT